MKLKLAIGLGLMVVILVSAGLYFARARTKSTSPTIATNSDQKSSTNSTAVQWKLEKDQTWVASGTPPKCPPEPMLTMPADINLVTGVLYPGQPRGDAFKPHGGFRFPDNLTNNQVVVTAPLDADIIQGSRGFRNGENQYAFVFVNSCGIWYSLGHLLELSPKFLAIANTLPLVDDDKEGFHVQQFYDVTPPVAVKTGEVLATAVGYAKQNNVFFDWGVLDLRHKNGFTIRSEWAAQFGKEFDQYAVCWLEMLPASDTTTLKALKGGDSVYGRESDYCH